MPQSHLIYLISNLLLRNTFPNPFIRRKRKPINLLDLERFFYEYTEYSP